MSPISGKLCPRLAIRGIFDKDSGGEEAMRIKLCETCPLDYCVYDHKGAISGKEIKILLGAIPNSPPKS